MNVENIQPLEPVLTPEQRINNITQELRNILTPENFGRPQVLALGDQLEKRYLEYQLVEMYNNAARKKYAEDQVEYDEMVAQVGAVSESIRTRSQTVKGYANHSYQIRQQFSEIIDFSDAHDEEHHVPGERTLEQQTTDQLRREYFQYLRNITE